MKTGVDKIVQMRGGDPEKNKTGVDRIIELLGGDPPAKNQTGVDKIVEILENGGGGGNPNSVQVINGTIAEPWGDIDPEELFVALKSNNASIGEFVFDASALSFGRITNTIFVTKDDGPASFYSGGAEGSQFALSDAYTLQWSGLTGELILGVSYASDGTGTDLSAYASLIPTTLTIIWHPLPTP